VPLATLLKLPAAASRITKGLRPAMCSNTIAVGLSTIIPVPGKAAKGRSTNTAPEVVCMFTRILASV